VPREPAPTPWRLEPPPGDHPGDLWAAGADLEPGTLLAAYRLGLFPMPYGETIGWFSPRRRAIVPPSDATPSRSLRRAARRYELRTRPSATSSSAAPARATRPAGSTARS
jgi:leucyl/phenylalanyl-tRNA---protein transferase